MTEFTVPFLSQLTFSLLLLPLILLLIIIVFFFFFFSPHPRAPSSHGRTTARSTLPFAGQCFGVTNTFWSPTVESLINPGRFTPPQNTWLPDIAHLN